MNYNDLTPRQWQLYNLLLTDTDKWFSKEEICSKVEGYEYNTDEKAHDRCATIRQDKVVINKSSRVDHIIVMKNNCFKIATIDEYITERNSHIARLKSQVEQIKAMDNKMLKDGQGKILNNAGNLIKDTDKQFYEVFTK